MVVMVMIFFDNNDGGDDYFDAYGDNNYNDYRLPLLTDWSYEAAISGGDNGGGDYFDDNDDGGDI